MLGNISQFISTFLGHSASNPTWDVGVILVLVAIGFFYGISAGHRRIASSIIYTYVALALISIVPVEKIAALSGLAEFVVRIGSFLLLFLLLLILFRSERRRERFLTSPSAWWQSFVLSFLQAGLLVHIIFNLFPPEISATLAPITRTVFAATQLHALWLGAPILVLIFLRRTASSF